MKKSLSLVFYSIVVLFSIFSCKKKENTPDAPAATTTTGSTTVNGASFTGLFSNQLVYSIFGTNTFTLTYGQNQAFMSASSFDNFNFPVGVFQNAGNLSLNGVIFKNLAGAGYYSDTTNTTQPAPLIWQATGGTVPAFSFTNTNSYSLYSGYTAWPDTITKSTGLTLSFNSVTDADEVMIYVDNAGSSTPAATGTLVLSSSTGYTFNASSVSALSTATTAFIQVDFYRNNIQTINGKTMNFRNVTSYIKNVGVKN